MTYRYFYLLGLLTLSVGGCDQQAPSFTEKTSREGELTARRPQNEGDASAAAPDTKPIQDMPIDSTTTVEALTPAENAPRSDDATSTTPETGAALALACKAAAASGSIKRTSVPINFPSAIECAWNMDGNLSRLDGKIRARREQFQPMAIANARRVCDMRFDFPTQQMEYDDEVFILLNGYVLAMSQDYSVSAVHPNGLKPDANGFVKYKWSGDNGLVDLKYGHRLTPRYCLGSDPTQPEFLANCLIPETQTTGQMKISVPTERIRELSLQTGIKYDQDMANGAGGLKADFGFVTIGDNDNGDCRHAAYSFQVVVDYLD